MSVDRLERVNALLRREIAAAIPAVMGHQEIDPGAFTVTQVRVARNLRNATISVSILGHEGRQAAMIGALKAKANEFQRLINRDMKLKYTPVLRFVLDQSLAKGDHVLALIDKLAIEEPLEASEIPPEMYAAGSEQDAT